jgi:hypothetical protein
VQAKQQPKGFLIILHVQDEERASWIHPSEQDAVSSHLLV